MLVLHEQKNINSLSKKKRIDFLEYRGTKLRYIDINIAHLWMKENKQNKKIVLMKIKMLEKE